TTFTGATAVKFGTVAASSYTVDDDSHITVTVPTTAVRGNVTVTTPAGPSNPLAFTVVLPPTISSFSPVSGVAGTVVTITGTNLAGPTAATFNGTPAVAINGISATQVKATVAPGATSGKIALTSIAGTAHSAANFTIPFAITSFSPQSGLPGDTVTITGIGFSRVIAVKFGSAQAGGTVDSDTQITVTVPLGATDGPIVISDGSVATPSASSFDVIGVFARADRIAWQSDKASPFENHLLERPHAARGSAGKYAF